MSRIRAILWAQWRSSINLYWRGGIAWTAAIGVVWYGFWTFAAIATARLFSSPQNFELVKSALPWILLAVFLYWQVIPLLLASTGAQLEIRKLLAYPIPATQFFTIETALRVTAAVEMVLILFGIATGILLNPEIPKWCALAILPYVLFNLFLAIGVRDLLSRILAHKRLREIAVFLLVMCAALPQLLLTRGSMRSAHRPLFAGEAWAGWPWTATANLLQGSDFAHSAAILAAWMVAAAVFGRWQFGRTLAFDAEAARSGGAHASGRQGLVEKFYRWPSVFFNDPLAALIEKEIRFLLRSPRFRLVFLMGFTFGLAVWLPMALGRTGLPRTFIGNNYLTVVSVYSLLLLSEVCFWNSFGFDRAAAQIYFLAPVPFSRVLIGKNISAVFFIGLEISAITTVCAILGMPLNLERLAEAYSVAGVVSVFLMGFGNLFSIHQARAVNPVTSFRSGAAGRVQMMLFVIYPIAFLPAALAYLARWAFDSQAAFFAVLALDAATGLIVYRIALESAVESSERLKEKMIAALSVGEAPITG